MKESLNITGAVELILKDSAGWVKQSLMINNLVTTAGKNFVVRKIDNDAEDVGFIAIGSGTTAPTVDDTDIETELASNAVLFTSVDSVNTDIISFTTTFAEGVGTGTVNEVALLSDSDPQKLLCRAVLTTPFDKSGTDYLTVTWKIKIG